MTKELIAPALFGAALFGAICGVLLALWCTLPQAGVNWYPSLWMRLAAVSPVFMSALIARRVYGATQRPMTGADRLTFAAAFCLGVGGLGVLTEAGIIALSYGKAQGIGFFDVLFQPLSDRYSIVLLAGLSLPSVAVIAAGFTALLSVPIRVLKREQDQARAQAD